MERGALLGRLTGRLFRLGSVAAYLATAFAALQVAIEVVALSVVGRPPVSAQEWLELLRAAPLVGLTELTFFQLPMFVLLIPVIGAICVATRDEDAVLAAVAFVLALVGITVFLATDPALALFALSKDYALSGEADRAEIVAAARAVMALATVGVDVGTSILAAAWIAVGMLMRRAGNGFAWITAALAIVAGLVELVAIGVDLLTPMPNILLLEIAGALVVLWLLTAGRDLSRLARTGR